MTNLRHRFCCCTSVPKKYFIPANNEGPGPEVINLFPFSTQLSAKFQLLIKTKILFDIEFIALGLSTIVFIMLINVKMPIKRIVDI